MTQKHSILCHLKSGRVGFVRGHWEQEGSRGLIILFGKYSRPARVSERLIKQLTSLDGTFKITSRIDDILPFLT